MHLYEPSTLPENTVIFPIMLVGSRFAFQIA